MLVLGHNGSGALGHSFNFIQPGRGFVPMANAQDQGLLRPADTGHINHKGTAPFPAHVLHGHRQAAFITGAQQPFLAQGRPGVVPDEIGQILPDSRHRLLLLA